MPGYDAYWRRVERGICVECPVEDVRPYVRCRACLNKRAAAKRGRGPTRLRTYSGLKPLPGMTK